MAKTIEQLKAQGAEVKNATVVGENTATRVGTLFTDIVEHVEQYEAEQAADTEANALAINNEAQTRAKADEGLNAAIVAEKNRAEAAEKANAQNIINYGLEIPVTNKGWYISNTGEIIRIVNNNFCVSPLIDVEEGDCFIIKNALSLAASQTYALYDADKKFVSSSINSDVFLTIPQGVAYVAFSRNTDTKGYVCAKEVSILNKKIGDHSFFAYTANVGYSLTDVVPNYIIIKVDNQNHAIIGIQFKICTGHKGIYNVLAYFNQASNDSHVFVTGTDKIKIQYLIKDEEFYIAIEKGTVLKAFTGIYVDTLLSYLNRPIITNKKANLTIFEADDISDYTSVYSYEGLDTAKRITDLQKYYSTSDETDNNLTFSTYPVIAYTSWDNGKTGALVIKFPPFSNEVFITFDIKLYRYKYAGCTVRVSGFLTSSDLLYGYAKVINGKVDTIYRKVRLGYISETKQVCVILGETNSNWNFTNFTITNVNTHNQSRKIPLVDGWDLSFETDLTNFNAKEVDFSIDSDILPEIPVSKLPEIPVSKITGLNTVSNQLAQYCDVNYIRTKLSKFYKSIYAKEKNTPYNLLFLGDSITNFQNGWASGADKTLPDVSNDKPLCMYNKDTFTNRIWALLNPNALDRANRDKLYGGNMTFIKATADNVVKSGTWVNGYDYNKNEYVISSLGGHTGGIKDFIFSVDENAYLEFTIPANSKGFSIVAEIMSGKRSYNNVSYDPSENVEVYLDGSLLDTISMNSSLHFQKRFDFVISNPTNSIRTVKIQNKEAEKWVFIWGIESWIDTCVRPINNAFAGSSMFTGESQYNGNIACYEPDIIIHEANLLNDTRVDLEITEGYYEDIYTRIKSNNIPILVLVTHAPASTYSSITVEPDNCPDMEDANQTPKYYNQYCEMIKRVCGRHDIPYINVFQYQYDTYNGVIPSNLFVDGIHLSENGHNMYKTLINYAFENNY